MILHQNAIFVQKFFIMVNFNDTKTAFDYKSTKDLKRSRILFKTIAKPKLVETGKFLTNTAMKIHFPISWAIKPTLYKHFVGGETLSECEGLVADLAKYNVKSILDYSVEGGNDEELMTRTLNETMQSVLFAAKNENIQFAVFKPTAFASQEILTLISEKATLTEEQQKQKDFFDKAVSSLCEMANKYGTPIMIDAEDSWYQVYVDEIVEEMMMKYNKKTALVYNTIQMYRTDRLDYLQKLYEKAVKEDFIIGAKFVRGAYMEKERQRAAERGYPSPIQPTKEDSDKNYDAGLKYAVEHIDRIHIFSGSHNENSNLYLVQLIKDNNLQPNDERIWVSQLYGMSDHISFNMAAAGYNVVKYTPYGPVHNIVPYLLRRAEENTSIAGQTTRELFLINKEVERRKKEGRK